jgi:hypothetical protein
MTSTPSAAKAAQAAGLRAGLGRRGGLDEEFRQTDGVGEVLDRGCTVNGCGEARGAGGSWGGGGGGGGEAVAAAEMVPRWWRSP